MSDDLTAPGSETADVASNDPVSVTNRMLTAGQRGSTIEAELPTLLDDDCTNWIPDVLPWGGQAHGRDKVLGRLALMFELFEVVVQSSEVQRFNEDESVLRAEVLYTSRKTGKSVAMPVIEFHRSRNGRIVHFDIYYKNPDLVAALAAE
ncbi:nuclear transport factor 2 family protein [Streptomyces sp. SP18BB07]|uniref:nuclear transport factor 2 family protein n=1 Tax=Streptomyces sp. SP18BB07 TaxID=3002522 RepID=UPI002E76DA34|nr:nuclear transport factor 2 family protein [Streptomyces sp. SP18BB07]MEE1760389.1 nuclear transport factor 2 family protein [Streptomyces sp. SP18BB07]